MTYHEMNFYDYFTIITSVLTMFKSIFIVGSSVLTMLKAILIVGSPVSVDNISHASCLNRPCDFSKTLSLSV